MCTMAALCTDQLVVVTGAGGGIGSAICQVLAREGAKVVVTDLSYEAAKTVLESLTGEAHEAHEVDVTDAESVADLFARVKTSYSRAPDVLINCAGVIKRQPMLEMSKEDFEAILRVNLTGTFLVTQACSRLMIQEQVRGASIVNFCSIAAKSGALPGYMAYAASKGGVASLTKSAAKELAPHGIRCNAILPGSVNTSMLGPRRDEVMLQKIGKMALLGRVAEPKEVAELCAFLASPRSSYMTGALVEVTGGMSC